MAILYLKMRRWAATKLIFLLLSAALLSFFIALNLKNPLMSSDSPVLPRVSLKNGTYVGIRNDHFSQDLFLGMPYALPPLGDLRFDVPHPLNDSWVYQKEAQHYGPHCLTYGSNRTRFRQSEDCLTINVVRPHVRTPQPLPVAVFFYGGGKIGGGSSDPRYNISFIVAQARALGTPFIGVSLNFRATVWGFIAGDRISEEGKTNLGLRDQRMALQWIQENIHAFNGNPRKVTIWGGSSGASNVGAHLIAFGGRDDGLFRAAIMQSGSPIMETSLHGLTAQTAYDKLTHLANCSQSHDTLQCLRQKPYADLDAILEMMSEVYPSELHALSLPTVDGEIIETLPSVLLERANIVPVPIIIGTTTNEGSTFVPGRLDEPDRLSRYLARGWHFPEAVVQRLLSLYPLSHDTGQNTTPSLGLKNAKFLQASTLVGDLELIASHRLTCEVFSIHAHCFSFRFDAVPSGGDTVLGIDAGVTHGVEIGPLFQNTEGIGFTRNPFLNQSPSYFKMSRMMGEMWANFIVDLDPNGLSGKSTEGTKWPSYDLQDPKNMVFGDLVPCHTESDTSRREGISYINSLNSEVIGR